MAKFRVSVLTMCLAATLAPVPSNAQQMTYSLRRGIDSGMSNPRLREGDFFVASTFNRPMASSALYAAALKSADCIASADRPAVAAALTKDAGSSEEIPVIQGLILQHQQCAQRGIRVSAQVMRAAMAETLWKQGGSLAGLTLTRQITDQDVEGFIRQRPYGDRATRLAGLPLFMVARCQVLAMPRAAAEILRSSPGSSEEQIRVRTLFKQSRPCGVPASLGSIAPIDVRAAIADALYQRESYIRL